MKTAQPLATNASADSAACIIPTTESQREVWLSAMLGTEASLAYNESIMVRFLGSMDVQAMERAVNQLVDRHQSLRGSITPDGSFMRIEPVWAPGLRTWDLQPLDTVTRALKLKAACDETVTKPFALEHGPLFRAALYRTGANEHELLLSAHHVACDGWSWGVITKELGQLYAQQVGGNSGLAPAPTYAAFAAEQAFSAMQPSMRAHTDYWLERFSSDTLPVLELPTDRPRPSVRKFASRCIEHHLDEQLVRDLRVVSAKSGVSLFVGLLSAFVATLHRVTSQDDIVVAIPASGQLAHDMPGLVGHCVNLLPLRIEVNSHMRFDTLMGNCSSALLGALEHQALSYGALLGQLSLRRDASRQPLVSAMFNVDPDVGGGAHEFSGLVTTVTTVPRHFENFELFLNLRSLNGGFIVEAQYNTDIFDELSAQRWLDLFESLLRSAAQVPTECVGRLKILCPKAVDALVALQPPPTLLAGLPLAHAAFVARAFALPDRPAIRDGTEHCSYGDLDVRSNQLARALRDRGMGRGHYVGLCLQRGIDMVVAMLAILKCGAAYVPLDPSFPQRRLDQCAQDAGLGLLLTSSSIATAPRRWCSNAGQRIFEIDRESAWQEMQGEALVPDARDAQPDDLAYVIYTSGSTGSPKGVCVPHRAVANLIESMRATPGICETDRLAAVTTLSFDIAVAELLLPLAAGAEIVMVQRDVAADGTRLRALLDNEAVSILQATPGTWETLRDAGWMGAPGFCAWIGGESVRSALAIDLLDRCESVWNVYGPTETTVWSTAWKMERATIAARGVAIGKPISNTSVWILDAQQQLCAIGVPGEICIAGAGIALGYLHRPDLTSERFVTADVLDKATAIYRTGDLGRWRNDGLLEHLGRLDFQVKVRGYRIEPGEIEARCNEVNGVARSIVVAREDRPGDIRLVAYLALQADTSPESFDVDSVLEHLRASLPAYMLPQHLVTLPTLPTLPNGKLDRTSLPAPQVEARNQADQDGRQRNSWETKVIAAMEQVLSLPGLGLHDDFFKLGGHSLLAARLAVLLGSIFGITLPLSTVFEAPNAQLLALAIKGLMEAGATVQAPLSNHPDRGSAPLTPAQERIRFLEELHPGRSVYNVPSARRLLGALDPVRFESVLHEIIRRQPVLRTCIGTDPATGRPVQTIARESTLFLPLVDLRELPADQREAELAERMQDLADRPIDIHHAPLLHAALFRLDENEHVFVFVPHHLIWDGWSFDILQSELNVLYGAAEEGHAPELPSLATTHGDYSDWLEAWTLTPAFQRQLDFLRQRLVSAPAQLEPCTDMPRRAGKSGQGGSQWIAVDLAATQRLRETARSLDVTLGMLTFGIYALTMSRIIGSETVVIANPVRGRQQPETEAVMGIFNNLLPISLAVDTRLTLPAFMRYVKRELLTLMNYQQVPFERLSSELTAQRQAGAYQAMFSYQDARDRPPCIGSLQTRQIHLMQRGATDDLGVWLLDTADGLQGALIYNADIFLRETGVQVRDRYVEILLRTVDQPEATLANLASEEDSSSAVYLRKLSADPLRPPAPRTELHTRTKQPQIILNESQPPAYGRLAQIWANVLNIDAADIRGSDNFFDLGGDSLLVQRAVEQAALTLGIRAEPRRYLFENLAQISGVAQASGDLESVASLPRRGDLLRRTIDQWLRGGPA